MKEFLSELKWRGLLFDSTPKLEQRLAKGPITGYVGFDPTAPSLQIGNLVPLMLLAHLQRFGGRPIVLMGGGTGLIGDPSGKSEERPLLSEDQIRRNGDSQRVQMSRFLDFDDPKTGALLLDNSEWLCSMTLVEFLRNIGKHFTISYMTQKESVRARTDSGISFTEFSYMLLQAYDFLNLYQKHHCELQLGGSDQWGNITAGTELVRRVTGEQAHGLCAPLITAASGAKFGKTESGSVWLEPDATSPYRFYQFWINVGDADVENYLKIFTFKTKDEITMLMTEHSSDTSARIPHRELARDVTERVHGENVARAVEQASRIIFRGANLHDADAATWLALEQELPTWEANPEELPIAIVDLVAGSGLTKSKGEARRQLRQGGVYVNNERVDENLQITREQLLGGKYLWLRRGKKNNVIVKIGAT